MDIILAFWCNGRQYNLNFNTVHKSCEKTSMQNTASLIHYSNVKHGCIWTFSWEWHLGLSVNFLHRKTYACIEIRIKWRHEAVIVQHFYVWSDFMVTSRRSKVYFFSDQFLTKFLLKSKFSPRSRAKKLFKFIKFFKPFKLCRTSLEFFHVFVNII